MSASETRSEIAVKDACVSLFLTKPDCCRRANGARPTRAHAHMAWLAGWLVGLSVAFGPMIVSGAGVSVDNSSLSVYYTASIASRIHQFLCVSQHAQSDLSTRYLPLFQVQRQQTSHRSHCTKARKKRTKYALAAWSSDGPLISGQRPSTRNRSLSCAGRGFARTIQVW